MWSTWGEPISGEVRVSRVGTYHEEIPSLSIPLAAHIRYASQTSLANDSTLNLAWVADRREGKGRSIWAGRQLPYQEEVIESIGGFPSNLGLSRAKYFDKTWDAINATRHFN